MYKNIELIHTLTHKESFVKAFDNFAYAKEMISTPITIAEFYECCKDYPILFVKDAEGNWSASAMLGFKEKENIFVDENGTWENLRYVPASIRRYPFIFVNHEDNKLSLGLDSSAKSAGESKSDRKLFDEEGKPSEFLTGVMNFMNQFQADAGTSGQFIKQLDQWGLLEEKTAQIVTPDQTSYQINGFYVVNEEKLQHLSKKKKQEMCDHNAFQLITAHLISLSNVQRMGMR
ncbi:MAG: SapC family protein [Sulfuricurvum sp.]|uniref:SapC family protein n=1 Tax=Sulfuricurvum sp. TaxID=2025608 RepID=UPI002A671052|nr:SapC family protein [Sulfuricurvum sp.]